MAFTKITAAGIGSTETVTLDGLSVINNGSFGGNLTVGGVLTYEDVTNVDSVGLITARNGIVVGSGITLSKDGDIFATGITTVSGNVKVGTGITLSPDGDVFFTGIATGNGSGLTALNASNISSGTVPTARLGSGTASSSTFLRGDSTFATVTSTTINNNADNRVITGSGTANTLEGETNLTFDGTTFEAESGSGVQVIRSKSGGSSGDYAIVEVRNSSTSRGRLVGDAAVDAFRIDTAGGGSTPITFLTGSSYSERLRITSGGKLLVGTSSDYAENVQAAFYGASNGGIALASGTSGNSRLMFADGTSGSGTGAYIGSIIYAHSDNSMRFTTNVSEALRIASNGAVSINYAGTGDNNLHIGCTSNQGGIIIKAPGNHYANIDVDANRSGADNGICNVQGKWNGTAVAAMSFTTGSDTTNKDDGYVKFYTTESGASMNEAARFASDNTFHLASTGSDDIVYSMQTGRAQHSNGQSKTYRITGLAWGQLTFSIGVGDGNYKRAHVVVKLGGSQWSTSNSAYVDTVEINDASGINVSFNKETTYYDITIANAGNSNTIYGAWQLEASNYSNLGKPTLTIT